MHKPDPRASIASSLLALAALLLAAAPAARAAGSIFGSGSTCPANTSCPAPGGTGGTCNAPGQGDPSSSACGGSQPATQGSSSPSSAANNPINVATGNKYQREVDLPALPGVLGLELVRHYNSLDSLPGHASGVMGRGWRLSYETRLYAVGHGLQVIQADGSRLMFGRTPEDRDLCTTPDPANGRIAITRTAKGDEYTWTWRNGRRLSFDTRGLLVQIHAPTGEFVSLQYDGQGQLMKVTDPQGRSLVLNYLPRRERTADAARPRFSGVQRIDTPVGGFGYAYGSAAPKGSTPTPMELAANLVRMTPPGGAPARGYVYEDARHPTLLSGIVLEADGQPQRLATYGYDERGWAVSSRNGPQVSLQEMERASLDERGKPGRVLLVHGRTAQAPQGRPLEVFSAQVAGQYRITQTRGVACPAGVDCPEANVRYRYDAQGRVVQTVRYAPPAVVADGRSWRIAELDRPLSGSKVDYDAQGRAVRFTQLSFPAAGGKAAAAVERVLEIREYAAGQGDGADRLLAVRTPSVVAGQWRERRLAYNAAGQVTQVSERGWSPALAGQPAQPLERASRFSYATVNGRSVLVAADGPLPGPADTTRYVWDRRADYLQSIQAPGDYAMKILRRDAAGRGTLVAEDDGSRYRETTTRYDGAGRVLARQVAAWLRSADGLLPASRLAHATSYDYDHLGRLVAVHAPDGGVLRTAFGADGQVASLNAPDGSSIALQRDADGRLAVAQRLDRPGHVVQNLRFERDANDPQASRLSGLADELGSIVRFDYEGNAVRPAAVRHADGRVTRYGYDVDGILVRQVQADGTGLARETTWSHDADGRVVSISRGAAGQSPARRQAAVYDDFGNKLAQGDGEHGVKRYVWDQSARLVAEVDEGGQVLRHAYDVAGRLVRTGADGEPASMTFKYDGSVRIEAETAGSVTERLRHDALGRIVESQRWSRAGQQVQDGFVRTSATAAALPRLLVRTLWRYDERGRLAERTLVDLPDTPQARSHRQQYTWNDATGALQRISYNGQTVVEGIRSTVLGGLSGYTHGNGVAEDLERDARGRLVRQRMTAPAGLSPSAGTQAVMFDARYAYDTAGRLQSSRSTLEGRRHDRAYGYDLLGRLTSERDQVDAVPVRFAYDPQDNRTKLEGPQGAQDYLYAGQRLAAVRPSATQAGWLQTYLTTGVPLVRIPLAAPRTPAQPAPLLRHIRHVGGRPSSVSEEGGRVVASYTYGLHGERLSKTLADPQGQVRTTHYLYEETASGLALSAELDGQGRIVRQYVYLEGRPVACIDAVAQETGWRLWSQRIRSALAGGRDAVPEAKASIFALHADQRLAPVAVTDRARRVVWSAEYTAFGRASVHAPAAAGATPFRLNLRLAGQYFDEETGLHDNVRRQYDPDLGRYTTADPLSLGSGSDLGQADARAGVNVYGYVAANPLTLLDPQGLYQEDVHYYMTYFLALAAGMDYAEARTIALAAQYVDDNPATRPLDDTDLGTTVGSITKNQQALLTYHFVLSDRTGLSGSYGKTPTYYNNSDLLLPAKSPSHQMQQLISGYTGAPTRCGKLQFFGEFLHAFEDTFGHRDAQNKPVDALTLGLGTGHGIYGEHPDYTYNHEQTLYVPTPQGAIPVTEQWNNEARTLVMEKAVYDWIKQKSGLTSAGGGASWAQIEGVLRQFNATHESHDTGFGTKLTLLNQSLATFAKRPDGSAINLKTTESYDRAKAATNRRVNLCDAQGNRLKDSDYPLLILPQSFESCK